MSKLFKIAEKSELNQFDITYNGKRYRFNLHEELQINERRLNSQLKTHASSYSFLTQLLNHLIFEYDTLEDEKEGTYNKLYKQYKETKSPSTGRVYSDDMAKAMALSAKRYKQAVAKFLKMKLNKNKIERAVRSFETRAFLMQTLSANVRKEV